MEYVITAVVIAGFGYFLYTRIKASKNKSSTGTGGSTKRSRYTNIK